MANIEWNESRAANLYHIYVKNVKDDTEPLTLIKSVYEGYVAKKTIVLNGKRASMYGKSKGRTHKHIEQMQSWTKCGICRTQIKECDWQQKKNMNRKRVKHNLTEGLRMVPWNKILCFESSKFNSGKLFFKQIFFNKRNMENIFVFVILANFWGNYSM